MQSKDIISKVRFYLRDTKKLLWKDEELENMLAAAVRQYSEDTCIFCGVFSIMPNVNGEYEYPEDYIQFQIGWNKDARQIEPISVHDIYNFNKTGNIENIYDDAVTVGQYAVYPECSQKADYEVVDNDYGVFFHDYGLLENPFDYGLVYSVIGYEFVGDIIYNRIAKVEEVQDYTALIYKMLEFAHSTESEFADVNMAKMFRRSYEDRIARFKQNKHTSAGYYSVGIFY